MKAKLLAIKDFVFGKRTAKPPPPVCAEVQYLCDELLIDSRWTFPRGDLDSILHVSGIKLSFVTTRFGSAKTVTTLLDDKILVLSDAEFRKLADAVVAYRDRRIAQSIEKKSKEVLEESVLKLKSATAKMKSYESL